MALASTSILRHKRGLATVVLVGMCLPGCMCRCKDLVQEGKIQVDIHNSCQAKFVFVTVHENAEGYLSIYGRVKRQRTSLHALHTGIEMRVVDSNGTTIELHEIPCVWLPRKCPGKGPDSTRFCVDLKSKFIEGMKVIVSCKPPQHSERRADSTRRDDTWVRLGVGSIKD